MLPEDVTAVAPQSDAGTTRLIPEGPDVLMAKILRNFLIYPQIRNPCTWYEKTLLLG